MAAIDVVATKESTAAIGAAAADAGLLRTVIPAAGNPSNPELNPPAADRVRA